MTNTLIIRDEALRKRALDLIAGLNLDKPWQITVEPFRKKRTLEQSALYHKWVGIVADHTGHSHDEIHEWTKAQFLAPKVVEVNGRQVEYRSTTKLHTKEMSDMMTAFYAWATSELGLFLPVPEQQHEAA